VTNTLGFGLPAALIAATFYGCSPAVQAMLARREPTATGFGWRLMLRLATRPIWMIAFSGEIVGFALEAYAFSVAPATLVAPIMACDLIAFVLTATLLFREKLTRTGIAGVATMTGGVGLLALAFAGKDELGRPASDKLMVIFLIISVGACAVLAGVGTRTLVTGQRVLAAALFSAAAGASYGLATMATRQIGRVFSPDHPWHLLATATPYTLIVCSLLGIGMMQRGLQTSALIAFPIVSAMGALLPVILGSTLLDDQVPSGWGRLTFVFALVCVGTGVVLLGRDRAAAERAAAGEAKAASTG